MTSPPPGGRPAAAPDVLVVCTANVARSPLLQARLQDEADVRLGAGVLKVGSVGTHARFGDPAAEGSRTVAARWGLTLDDHLSQPAMYVELPPVTLVLTSTRAHVRALVARSEGIAARCFTVRELLASLAAVGDRLPPSPSGADRQDLDAVRRHLATVIGIADRHRPRPLPWRRRHLDVPDPIGGDQAVFDALGVEFAQAAATLGEVLFGPAPDG